MDGYNFKQHLCSTYYCDSFGAIPETTQLTVIHMSFNIHSSHRKLMQMYSISF